MDIISDIARLKQAIVHRPGAEIFKVLAVCPDDHPMLPVDLMGAEAMAQHDEFVRLLVAHGVELLFVEDLLDDAIVQAKRRGAWQSWLCAHAPSAQKELAHVAGALTASALMGAAGAFVYRADALGKLAPLFAPMKWMFYCRDFCVATPRGVVLCNFLNYDRAFEASLARFMFDHARALDAYPIVFDAVEENVYLQGGDVILGDPRTLFVGIGNLSEERAARLLAQRLDMDVVGVRLPGRGRFQRGQAYAHWTGLHLQLLHLDTFFTFVDTDKVLTLPYLLESRHVGCDPLTRILEGLRDAPGVDEARVRAVLEHLREVGWVTLYRAGSGEIDASVADMKLVDYLRTRGYQVIPVGGEPAGPEVDDFQYMVEQVLRELRFQGANVLAIEPGKLIAYSGNEHTLAALRAAGLEVATFAAHELVRWNGGPHCMAMSLVRWP